MSSFSLPWDGQTYLLKDGGDKQVPFPPRICASPCHACHLGDHVQHSGIGYSWPYRPVVGPSEAAPRPVLFIGEAPGATEDTRGAPFCGKSGSYLWDAIRATGVPAERAAFSNVVQCVPWADTNDKQMGVRPPTDEEIMFCHLRLVREIQVLDPVLLVPLGGSAAGYVLHAGVPGFKRGKKEAPIGSMRGRLTSARFGEKDYPVFPMHHPAAVLRNRKWEHLFQCDLLNVRNLLAGTFGRVPETVLLDTTESALSICAKIRRLHEKGKVSFFTFDFECTGLYPWKKDAEIVGVSLAFGESVGYYIPLSLHGPDETGKRYDPVEKMDIPAVKQALKELLENVPSANQNLKFEYIWAAQKLGVRSLLIYGDPMLGAGILFGEQRDALRLDRLLTDYRAFPQYDEKLEEYKADHKIVGDYSAVPLPILYPYGGIDAAGAHGLVQQFQPQLQAAGLELPYYLSMRAIPVYAHIEMAGIAVDRDLLQPFRKKFITAQRETFLKMLEDPEVMRFLTQRDKEEVAKIALLKLTEEARAERFAAVIPWKARLHAALSNPDFLGNDTVEPLEKFIEAVGFNPNSVPTIRAILFDHYKIAVHEKWKTPTGLISTAEGIIDSIAKHLRAKEPDSPALAFLELVLAYRGHVKMRGTYVDGLEESIRYDGTLQVQYNINGAATGRLSAEKFPFHQLPKSRELGLRRLVTSRWRDPKSVFEARGYDLTGEYAKKWAPAYPDKGGGLLLAADFSQLELRVLAIYAQQFGDPGMVEAFRQGRDLHRYVASRVFYPTHVKAQALVGPEQSALIARFHAAKPWKALLEENPDVEAAWKKLKDDLAVYQDVCYAATTKSERDMTKQINFGIVYGAQAHSIAVKLPGKNEEEVQEVMNEVFRTFPGILAYIKGTHGEAKATAMSHTLTHRVRYHFMAKYGRERDREYEAALREAQNARIQGTASDICVQGNLLIASHLNDGQHRSLLCGSVHDSSMIDVFPGELVGIATSVKSLLESSVPKQPGFEWIGDCPITVDIGVGTSFGTEFKIKGVDGTKFVFEGFEDDAPAFLDVLGRGYAVQILERKTEDTPDGRISKITVLFGDPTA